LNDLPARAVLSDSTGRHLPKAVRLKADHTSSVLGEAKPRLIDEIENADEVRLLERIARRSPCRAMDEIGVGKGPIAPFAG